MEYTEYLKREEDIIRHSKSWEEQEKNLKALYRQAMLDLQVGDGITVNLWTDRHAYTVIRRTPKTITVQRDKTTLNPEFKPDIIVGGFAGHCTNQNEQTYTYEPDTNGSKLTLRFSEKQCAFTYLGNAISLGRHEFFDYNF